jgi:aminoglycoside 6-adenylyltransferase
MQQESLINRIIGWARSQDPIRAVLLTSSRASTVAHTDALSDFDVVLVVTDPQLLIQDLSWQETIGEVMVRLPVENERIGLVHLRMVIHTDGTKVDYCIMHHQALEARRVAGTLPDNLDVGYRVLLDKDSLTEGLAAPTYSTHIPAKPTQAEFDAVVGEFFWETHYVAKNLWRDELWQAKYSLEMVMKLEMLRKMLEWWLETEHDWTFRPGTLGKGLKAHLPARFWGKLEQTFVGAEINSNWQAMFTTIELFREVALEVAERLELVYPHKLDNQVSDCLDSIKALPHRP